MHPPHNRITIPRPPQPQRLIPHLLLLALQLPQLLLLRRPPPIRKLHLPRRPPVFPALMHELRGVLLKNRHSIQLKLLILRQDLRTPRHHHGRNLLVTLQKVLDERIGDRDEVLLQILRLVGFEQRFRVDDRGERFLGQVAGVAALEGRQGGFGAGVLVEFLLDVVVDCREFFLQRVD